MSFVYIALEVAPWRCAMCELFVFTTPLARKYILLVHVIYSYGQDRMDSMGLSTQTSQFTMIMANELFVMGALS